MYRVNFRLRFAVMVAFSLCSLSAHSAQVDSSSFRK